MSGSDLWEGTSDADRGLQAAIDTERQDAGYTICDTMHGRRSWFCSRRWGHAGRHIGLSSNGIVAAWPGAHKPTMADLDAPRPDLDALPAGAVIRATLQTSTGLRGLFLMRDTDGSWWNPAVGSCWPNKMSDVVVAKVIWPREPLPAEPGTVILATACGKAGVRLVRDSSSDPDCWFSPVQTAGGRYLTDDDITEWRLLLAADGGDQS